MGHFAGAEAVMADHEEYDLCIVGAGIAGLSAAFVASRYLPSTARVLLIDVHRRAGGMWNDAYSYVRLHQPYQTFTAGNIGWSLGRERSYLATGDEVATHLRHCLDAISQRFDVEARWGWEYLGHTEGRASVVVTAQGPDGEASTCVAQRLIDARGFDIEALAPLQLASQQVRSVAPQDLSGVGLFSADDSEPVWVIGSGKTAMDTIVAVARTNPARPIGMVTGTGTYFIDRGIVNPTGLKRWMGGVRYSTVFEGAAQRFDGTNASEVSEWLRGRFGISPLNNPPPTHAFPTLLSKEEMTTVAAAVSDVVRDHLADVVDESSGPVMVLRSGARHPIPAGSWFVNCTGYLAPRTVDHIPYLSPSGKTMSVNLTSSTFVVPAVSAYFMSHLFFLDRLADCPLYELDFHGLRRNDPGALLPVAGALMNYNLSIAFERLPMRAFRDFHFDFDRWYPPVRQFAGALKFMSHHKRHRPQLRHALDTWSQHANVRCGLLSTTALQGERHQAAGSLSTGTTP